MKTYQIGLFMGSDISSHLLMNKLIPELKAQGHTPHVYLVLHKPSIKPALPEIARLAFYERGILNNDIYPLLDENNINAPNISPKSLAKEYGIEVQEITNINAQVFVQELKDKNIQGGISIRCYQKFKDDIIEHFNANQGGFLWNLHPGILPQYRGVMTLIRAMANNEKQTSYSLHAIDANWDAGALIDVRPQELNITKAMLTSYCDLSSSGLPIILENLTKLSQELELTNMPQNSEQAQYYSFPTQKDLDNYKEKGLSLVSPKDMQKIYKDAFYPNNSEIDNQVEAIIKKYEDEYLASLNKQAA